MHHSRTASPHSLRKAIEHLGTHDHPCLIYENAEELLSVVVPFIRCGWERRQRCLYFAPAPCVGGILKDLDSAGIESANALAEGALIMPNIHTIYSRHDPFAPDRVLEFLARAITEAKDEGFSGLRLIGEMPWALEGTSGVEPLIEYEAKLNDFILHHELPVLCLYDRTRFLPEVLIDAVRTHPKLIFRNVVSKSYFYLPPDQFFHSKRPDIEVNHLLKGMAVNEELISALEEREALLNAVVGNSPDSIFVKDLEGRYLMINPAGAAYLGKGVEEVVGRTDSEIFPPGSAEKSFEIRLEGLACGKPVTAEETIVSPSGTRTFHATRGVYCDARGDVVGLFGIVRDITERKNAENLLLEQKVQLEEINKSLEQRVTDAVLNLRKKDQVMIQQGRQAAMGEMIGNIAHQWRQPLNTLGLILQELLMTSGHSELKRESLEASIGKAMEVIYHMSKTINDFGNYFKPDRGKILFNANESVKKTLSLIEPSLQNLNINVAIIENEVAEVYGYGNEYSQVLLNILLNSRDAFEERNIEGPKVITVTVSKENDRSVVTVADSAGGIAGDIIDKIFDPYFTTKGPDKGTGIGLYMAKTIIEKNMGGRITVRNAAEGAEFRIEV